MRFKYSTSHPNQNEFDSLPRVPLVLRRGDQIVEALGLVDSGATINVLPYEIGLQLGGVWDENKAIIQLAGNLSQAAMPFFANAEIGEFPSVRLAFAWVSKPNAPLILGQTNFFMEFDVSFYRSKLEFEIKPKS
ncbi:hypothetical protein [Trichormus variabilis]|uniref:Peptidase A2 domain-containing protein n=1 Tax=Trichormus variabilis SAG 1403-4b TaxID=447716 RepID=A0A3S1ABB9_ANAVA|nr:hypothetical protein [Trichormus variabilis]MBD2627856.1 hypothetical protein [Trichormus variabilis FACHB-164]RUS97235.1 hypothetical protein DSM107003_19760 [Trichormus variabilis SAG 1403-4b]